MCEKYKGWTNYETWCVNLWLTNEEYMYNRYIELAKELDDYDTAQALKDMCEENMPDLAGTMYSDLLMSALADVNWYEIANTIRAIRKRG